MNDQQEPTTRLERLAAASEFGRRITPTPTADQGSAWPMFAFRIPNTNEGRALLAAMKETLNKDAYKLRIRHSGPRPQGTSRYQTLRENATSMRVYIDSRTS
jgi:hypothetical protein